MSMVRMTVEDVERLRVVAARGQYSTLVLILQGGI